MTKLKKSIVACGASMLVCVGLLAGTTFAWFSDSITNSGNSITAGELSISASSYNLAAEGEEVGTSVTLTPEGGSEEDAITYEFSTAENLLDGENATPIINDANWQPGSTSAKLLEVRNTGSLAASVKLDFHIQDATLAQVLWFDFVEVREDGQFGKFEQRAMTDLEELAGIREYQLAAEGSENDSISFVFVYGMNTEAGNEYQGSSFKVDATILAKQTDPEAEYPLVTYNVSDSEQLNSIISEEGGYILIQEDGLELNPAQRIMEQDTVIDLNGHDLTNRAPGAISVTNGATLTFKGGADEEKDVFTSDSLNTIFSAGENSTLRLENISVNAKGAVAVIDSSRNSAGTIGYENATIEVIGSDIYCEGYMAISTNATVNDYFCTINIADSTIECVNDASYGKYQCDNVPVLLNVPGRLTVTDSTLIGERQGAIVRSGEAVFTNTTIRTSGEYSGNTYLDKTWEDGNNLPRAALVIGNRTNPPAYHYEASVTLIDCIIESENAYVPAIYMWGNPGEDMGALLSYDAATVITVPDGGTDIFTGEGYIVVNGEVKSEATGV